MSESFLNDRVTLYAGDCLDVLATLEAKSVDSVVCDPPYHLTSIIKRFGASNAAPAQEGTDGAFALASRGFMGKQWDGGDVAFRVETWVAVLRVLKPGGHLVAFSGTRTYHRMVCAIEDVGFEIRDQIGWAFGSGFPKSHNAGNGWGTALKPAWEPICLARKPLIGTVVQNVLAHATGALNIDGCRVGLASDDPLQGGVKHNGHSLDDTGAWGFKAVDRAAGLGRWPANLVHDGSPEVLAAFPESEGGAFPANQRDHAPSSFSVARGKIAPPRLMGDSGSAARFFYTAKADADDRLGSRHPTVKPVDLMQWLVRLITPPGGVCLDPFAGTGTTGEAAFREGMRAILIEREAEYQEDIRRRMKLCVAGQGERNRESIKARGLTEASAGPLFEGIT